MKVLVGLKNGNALECEIADHKDSMDIWDWVSRHTNDNFITFHKSIVLKAEISFIHIVPEDEKKENPLITPAEVLKFTDMMDALAKNEEVPGEV